MKRGEPEPGAPAIAATMARRRRRKTSPWKALPLWGGAAVLAGWGLWQAELFRRGLVASSPVREVTTQPAMAVGSETVAPEGAMGGEPWAIPTLAVLETLSDQAIPPDGQQAGDFAAPRPEPGPAFDAALTPGVLIEQGQALLQSGQIVAARYALNTALARSEDDAECAQLRDLLGRLNEPVFLGSSILPDDPAARLVEIQPGDSFLKLGRDYGVPAAFLESINPTLNARALRPLSGVKVVQGPFHARVIQHAGRLDLYARELYIRSFPVDFPEGNDLPRGDYQITAGGKLQLGPTRTAGTRTWIGFDGAEPATQQVASGWIFGSAGPRGNSPKDRATGIHMRDSDLLQLYNVLAESRSHLRVDP